MPVRKEKFAVFLIPAIIALNVAIRIGSIQAVFVYGNIFCLSMLASVLLLLTDGVQRAWSVLLLAVMLSVLPDTMFFVPYIFQADDALLLLLSVGAMLFTWRKSGSRFTVGWYGFLALIVVAVKLVTQNSLAMIGDRAVYYIGNSFIHFALSVAILIFTVREYKAIPFLLLAATANDFIDNVWGDPYTLQLHEIIFYGWAILMALWWWVYSGLLKSQSAKRFALQFVIALHIFAAAFLCIGLYYNVFH